MKTLACALALSLLILPGLRAAPASAEQLRSEFEAALKAEDTNAIASLYDWRDVSDESKSGQIENVTSMLCGGKIESVKLTPLSSDYSDEDEMETDDGLCIVHKNIPAVGLIEVKAQPADANDSPTDMEIPYGKTNNTYCFSAVVMDKIPRSGLKEKSLKVIVTIGGGVYSATGGFTPLKPPTTFTGSCIYIKDGKEIKVNISGSESRTNTFIGNYIRSCTVRKTSGKGWINLYVFEDGRKTFVKEQQESGKGVVVEDDSESSNEPITYEIPKFEL
jgi:hypothetical protein